MTFPPISRFDTIFFFCPFSGTTNGGGLPQQQEYKQTHSVKSLPSIPKLSRSSPVASSFTWRRVSHASKPPSQSVSSFT